LIDRCDLVFLAKAKDGDYHQEMNGPIFLSWFENQLMPALKSPSVIVLDNEEFLKFDFFIKLFFSFKGLKRNVVF
jgi:hypothetical protein